MVDINLIIDYNNYCKQAIYKQLVNTDRNVLNLFVCICKKNKLAKNQTKLLNCLIMYMNIIHIHLQFYICYKKKEATPHRFFFYCFLGIYII